MKIPLIALFFFLPKLAWSIDPNWRSKSLQAISQIDSLSKDQQIEKLSGWVGGIGPEATKSEDQIVVFKEAQKKLLTISGSGEYLKNKILKLTAEGADSLWRQRAFNSLAYLPSVESVVALGELLANEKGGSEHQPGQDYTSPLANCRYASAGLSILIENPPHDPTVHPSMESAVDAWRLWYAQVKAGNRTFSFKGQPGVRYNLDGVVTGDPKDTSNSRQLPDRSPNSASHGRPDAASSEAVKEVGARSFPVGWIWAGVIAALGALGIFWMNRKKE